MTKDTTIIAHASPYFYDKHMLQDPYDAQGIRLGSWEIHICNVCACLPMTMLSVLLAPSIATAQVRVRMSGGSYTFALMKEMLKGALIIGLPFALYVILVALLDAETAAASTKPPATEKPLNKTVDATAANAEESVPIMLTLWVTGLTWVIVAFISGLSLADLRTRIRERFQIDGSQCTDLCVAFMLPTCAIAQMSSHLRCIRPGRCSLHRPDTLPAFES